MLRTLAAIASATLIITAATSTVRADDFDKKTIITVKENLLIPGRTLPPGKYVMKLLNATANRHIVQIFNEDQNKLEATIMAFNNYRLDPAGETILQYWETPAGSPPALRAWFYPGDNFGQEFAYPKEMADLLARENSNAKVPSYQADSSTLDADQLAKLEVRDADTTPAPVQQAQVTPPAPAPAPVVTPAPVVAPTETAVAPAPSPDNRVLAQNDTPAPATTFDSDARAEELPRTATNMPLVLALGILALAAAVGVRTMNRS